MKFATPLALALIALLPSCASPSATDQNGQPGMALTSPSTGATEFSQSSTPSPGASPMGVYSGARQVAGVVNTVRTLGGLL